MLGTLYLNNALAYIQVARDTLSKTELKNLCISFYKEDDIVHAKSKLCELAKVTAKRRIGNNKVISDMDDILDVFDLKADELPQFVSHGLHSSPPFGYEFIVSTMNTLKSEIERLGTEVANLRNERDEMKRLMTENSVNDFDIKKSMEELHEKIDMVEKNQRPAPMTYAAHLRQPQTAMERASLDFPPLGTPSQTPGLLLNQQSAHNSNQQLTNLRSNGQGHIPNATVLPRGNGPPQGGSGYQYRMQRNFQRRADCRGNLQLDSCPISGAKPYVNVYVGGCAKSNTTEALQDFCKNHLKIDFEECETLLSRSTVTKSFRIKVDVDTMKNIMKPELWPTDVYLRKFYAPKRPNVLNQNVEQG